MRSAKPRSRQSLPAARDLAAEHRSPLSVAVSQSLPPLPGGPAPIGRPAVNPDRHTQKITTGVHDLFVPSAYSWRVPRRIAPQQAPLPFAADPEAPGTENPAVEQAGIERPRRGRPRLWTSEAERKRAYRERLAADCAEPERLRRELRTERKRVADQERKLARLDRILRDSRAERADLVGRQAGLEAAIADLEAQVELWRTQAGSIEKRLDEERERARKLESPTLSPRRKGARQLPDLRLQQGGSRPQPPPVRRRD